MSDQPQPTAEQILEHPEFPIIITGYTKSSHLGDYYKRTVIRLIKSCVKFDLSHMVFPLKSTDDWLTGCSLKPTIILHALKTLQKPVLWIDADGEILRYPEKISQVRSKLAICSSGSHWLSGTLFIRPEITDFAEEWVRITRPDEADEITLLNLYHKRRPEIVILPNTYNTVIHTKTNTANIVIGHYIRPDVANSKGLIAVDC